MRYGFIIDNRKCIGCHACTTACKSEHQVPVGVNRTWVKQVEKGTFPHTRRLFSVMRCNHCTDAPCVEICPVQALFIRDDGIVDFDNRRCIGCKSCMQACPYDALYINPQNNTAAKCNYCAHRIDIGLEPACVNVCPEHAIISGDMESQDSEIWQLLTRQQVKVRKPEKATRPNLFYIDGDESSLTPSYTEKTGEYLWTSQARGVGHYAKHTEKLAWSENDIIESALNQSKPVIASGKTLNGQKSIDIMLGSGAENARRAYDSPDKGILWGWEVSSYVLTKAIAAGLFLVPLLGMVFNRIDIELNTWIWGLGTSLVFLGLTGALLVKDLDRPDRFLNVIFRPQWNSWLVRGGYSISMFGLFIVVFGVGSWFEINWLESAGKWGGGIFALITAVYTAFLFAQAKGRDFWQSPTLSIHMLVHSIMAGASAFALLQWFVYEPDSWYEYLKIVLILSLCVNLLVMLFEFMTPHPTKDAATTAHMITGGKYSMKFWLGTVLLGNLLPLVLLFFIGNSMPVFSLAAILVLIGILITEQIWVEAPQRIPLS